MNFDIDPKTGNVIRSHPHSKPTTTDVKSVTPPTDGPISGHNPTSVTQSLQSTDSIVDNKPSDSTVDKTLSDTIEKKQYTGTGVSEYVRDHPTGGAVRDDRGVLANPSDVNPPATLGNTQQLSDEYANRDARTQLSSDDKLKGRIPTHQISSVPSGIPGAFVFGVMQDIYPILKNTSMDSQQLNRAMGEIRESLQRRLS